MAGQLASVVESYVRLLAARERATQQQQRQRQRQRQQQQQQQQRDCGWLGYLCVGRRGVLQRVSEQQPLDGKYQRSFLSCLCSLLRLAGSDVRLRDAASMQEVCVSVLDSVGTMLVRSLPVGGVGVGVHSAAAGVSAVSWLKEYSPQLIAAGYPLQSLQEGLMALSMAADVAMQTLAFDARAGRMYSAVSVGLVDELVLRMHAVGAALGVIAVPDFCNNSSCVNVCGPSEVLLVSGRSCICAGCRVARYCGRVCQRQAWKQHKPVCKALAAAAAGVATPEAGSCAA